LAPIAWKTWVKMSTSERMGVGLESPGKDTQNKGRLF